MKITAEDARRVIFQIEEMGGMRAFLVPEKLFAMIEPEAMEEFVKAGIKIVKDCRVPESILKKGEKVFYASQNKGTIKGTHKKK